MVTLELKVDESILDKVLTSLNEFSKDKLILKNLDEYAHIPKASQKECVEIEEILKNLDCHISSSSELTFLTLPQTHL